VISLWRYVFDTNVLVAALRSERGASRRLLLSALDREIITLASVPLMIEYEAVLTRSQQLSATGLSAAEMNAVLEAVAATVEPIQLRFHWRPRLRDPADEMVLETAVNGRADRLVTFNLRHLKAGAEEFGIRTLTPPEACKEIQHGHAKK
jgi:putative PIN family toxin of toxin-antitoxin system